MFKLATKHQTGIFMKGIKHARHEVDFLSRKRKYICYSSLIKIYFRKYIYCLLRLSEFYLTLEHAWFTMHNVF